LKVTYLHTVIALGDLIESKKFYVAVAVVGPLKARHLHIKVAVGSLFESKGFYITHAFGGPCESKVLAQ